MSSQDWHRGADTADRACACSRHWWPACSHTTYNLCLVPPVQRRHYHTASSHYGWRAGVSSSTAACTTPTAQRVGSGEFPHGSAAQQSSSRILIENQGYAPFGSPPASLISRGGQARLYAGGQGVGMDGGERLSSHVSSSRRT